MPRWPSCCSQAVQPAQIELALAATQTAEAERQQLHRHWQERLERARYEATLARRRYEQVDPDNRLVAAELEQRWEARLQEVQTVEAEALKLHTKAPLPLSAQEEAAIRRLAEDLPALWLAPTTTPADRKRLLRCLIQSVTLDSFTQVGFTRILVLWHTGATSEVTVPRPRPGCRTPEASRHRIAELAQTMTDDQIAAQLNAEGLPTAWRGPWTQARIRIVRSKWRIPSAKPYPPRQILPAQPGLLLGLGGRRTTPRLARHGLRVVPPRPAGRLPGARPHRRLAAPYRDDRYRYGGAAPLTPDLILEADAPAALNLTPDEIRQQVQAGQLLTYRLWRNHVWRWYVQRPAANPQVSDH